MGLSWQQGPLGRDTIDGQKLEPVPGQTVVAHGADRNLSVNEVGGIRLTENESPARLQR
jgi:hypothetical protein